MNEIPSRPERTDDAAALFARLERLAHEQLVLLRRLTTLSLELHELAAWRSEDLAGG